MNKLNLENSLKDIEIAKTKIVKRIIYDCIRFMEFLERFGKWIDEDRSKLNTLNNLFEFRELTNDPEKLFFVYNDYNVKLILINVLLLLPLGADSRRRKFRRYKNQFGYYSNQEEKIKYQIWKIDVQSSIVNKIFYQDLSNMIISYL